MRLNKSTSTRALPVEFVCVVAKLEFLSARQANHLFHRTTIDLLSFSYRYRRFPFVVAGTLLVVFSVIAAKFRAAIVPLKLACTIAVPLAFIFGMAVVVYQKGALDGLGGGPFSSHGAGGISWLLPPSTVFVLIGLALDYDIFLFSRVYELRATGRFTTQQAIVEAVGITGPVISGAGLIMALAFIGMLANDSHFLNQFGFIAVLGVLLDSFVVRTILVPSILSVGGALNWWPGKMPPPPPVASNGDGNGANARTSDGGGAAGSLSRPARN